MQTDVLIIGGGPAGAATALSLLRYSGLKVTVVENTALDQVRVGENVSPALFGLLEYIGIDRESFGPGCFAEGYSSKASWGSAQISTRDSLFTSQGGNFQMDREQFDLHLLGTVIQRGGYVFPRTRCITIQQERDGMWDVVLQHRDSRTFRLSARYIVDATGRQSKIARMLGIEPEKYDQLLAVGAFLQPEETRTLPQELLLEAAAEGWWYTACLPGQKLVATFFTDADQVATLQLNKPDRWSELLAQTNHTRRAVSRTQALGNIWTRNAFSQLTDCTQRDNFITAGDAAAAFDPLSSMGIGFALSSAIQASRAILEHAQGAYDAVMHYQQDINRIFDDYRGRQHEFYRKESRWPGTAFWQRRHAPVSELSPV